MRARPGVRLQDRAKIKTETDLARGEVPERGKVGAGKTVSVRIIGNGSS
jgi:hypothetical protein